MTLAGLPGAIVLVLVLMLVLLLVLAIERSSLGLLHLRF